MRLAAGLNLEQAAAATGMERENIRKRETGEAQLRAHEIEKFAHAYSCSEAEILGHSPDVTRQEQAILQMFRAMTPEQQSTLFRLGTALAQPAELPVTVPSAIKRA